MTIRAVLIINNHGKARLTKFYSQLPTARQQALIRLIYSLVSKRPDGVCNFLDAPELTPLLPPPADAVSFTSIKGKEKEKEKEKRSAATATAAREDELRVIYRHYATLYFVFVVDQSESELGILDLIQVFVESLDRCFENVCELDLIFHFDQVHAILSEIIQGGLVVETNINEIVASAQTASAARKASAASGTGAGSLAANVSSLTPSALSNLGFSGPAGRVSPGSGGGGGGGGGISWPSGTFVVEAITNLGKEYLGRSRQPPSRFAR